MFLGCCYIFSTLIILVSIINKDWNRCKNTEKTGLSAHFEPFYTQNQAFFEPISGLGCIGKPSQGALVSLKMMDKWDSGSPLSISPLNFLSDD